MRFAAALSCVLLAGACASGGASSPAVPLKIPEPPAKVAMSPVPAEPPEPEPQSPPPPPVPTPAPPARPPAPAAAAPASAPPPAAPEPPRPAPELRPGGSAGRASIAVQVQDSLARTKQKLDAINPAGLNAGRRADYDSARRFLAQAEEAVKENNLMLAESSAEKAATLADGLR